MIGSANQKCRMHGGHAQHAIGTANSQFKHGRYSKYLPSKLDQLYREALSNPELLEMADHIALLEARMQDMLQTQAAGEPVPKWSQIAEIFAGLETALLCGDPEKSIAAMAEMHKLLDAGVAWDRTWAQVQDTMEQLRKMVDTEVKRKKELHQMVPIERVIILMAAVGEAVKRHVSDPAQIDAVYRELAVLHGTDNTPGTSDKGMFGPAVKRVGPEIIDVAPRAKRRRLKPLNDIMSEAHT